MRTGFLFFISGLVFCSLISLSGAAQVKTDALPFQYVSPMPGSQYHNPDCRIILRLAGGFEEGDLSGVTCTLTGSKSGNHDSDLSLSRDGSTINLKPREPFALNEQVEVQLIGLPDFDEQTFDWTFHTKSGEVIIEQEALVVDETERDYTTIHVLTEPTDEVYDGNLFLHVKMGAVGHQGIFDGSVENDPIWCQSSSGVGSDFKVNRNGLPTYWDAFNQVFRMFDDEMELIRTFEMVDGYTIDEHDFQIMPDGNYFLFAYDWQIIDMSELVEGGNPNTQVEGFVIQEFDYDDNLLMQWRSWDYFSILDNEDQNPLSAILTPYHINALEIDTDGNVFFSLRHTNEVAKYNRLTGDVMWRWTLNSYGQFDFVNDGGFSYQHDARRLENGNILLFDNANLTDQVSRAIEYSLDTVNWTATKVWAFEHPEQLFGSSRGGCQRLPNGNTIITWGQVGADDYGLRHTEVAGQGTIVFEIAHDLGFEGYRGPKHDFAFGELVGGCGDEDAPNYDPTADYWLPEFCQIDEDGDGFSIEMGDCDDDDDSIYPDAEEIPNDDIDQDCDGEDLVITDDDQDGDGVTVEDGDCNDDDDSVYPGAEEIPYDGIDQDCDGEDLTDVDEDGFSPDDGDCNDENEDINPDAVEIPYDGIDQDCDGEDLTDVDEDGFSPEDGDCNDEDDSIYPGAEEIANDGIDQDCDGSDLIVSVESLSQLDFSVWQGTDGIHIFWPYNSTGNLQVFDSSGRVLIDESIISGLNILQAQWASSIYIVAVELDSVSGARRIMVR